MVPDVELYLVGGAVRDLLLSRVSHDLDFAIPKDAIEIARRVANVLHADYYVLDQSFDTARVIFPADNGKPRYSGFRSVPRL